MSPGPVAMPGAPHPLPAGAQLRPVQNTGEQFSGCCLSILGPLPGPLPPVVPRSRERCGRHGLCRVRGLEDAAALV